MRLAGLATLLFAACAPVAPLAPAVKPPRPPAIAIAPPPLPSPAPELGNSRLPTAAEAAVIETLMRETEQLRGLHFRAKVDVRIQDKVAMRAYVKGALEDEDLQRARRRYVALGLIAPSLDIRELIEALMEEELIGYYDPKAKLLALRDQVASSLATQPGAELEWRATVVHELVHALQDQHLGLSSAMEAERTTDQENAFASVVEGDATLAMVGYMAARQGVSLEQVAADLDNLTATLRSGKAQAGGRLEAAPAIVREPLLFRYREGALFAARLYNQSGWRAVDRAHQSPPASTLSVREPQRYLEQREQPTLALPALDFLAQYACAEVDRDVLGGLELAAALARSAQERQQLERGWRGDRYSVIACPGTDASVWLVRFASAQAAQHARRAFERSASPGAPRTVWVHGSFALAVRGLPAAALEQLAPLFEQWASAAG